MLNAQPTSGTVPASSAVTRDMRIDFFRGLALYMILVDHVAGDPLGKLTFQRFGFSDAAEIFVFLSGVSCAIVYSGVLARRGWSGLLRSIARRAAYIYAFYLLTCIAVIFLTRAAASLTSASFNDDPFLVVIADPISAVQSAFLLTSPPALPGILVLYLMLTLIVIPLVLLISQRSAALALSVSAAIWTIAQFDPDLSPHLADHSVFDWLAWQFLFSIGMFVGLQRDHAWPIGASTYRSLVSAAWLIVIGSLAYRVLLLVAPAMPIDVEWLRLSPATAMHMKENLSAVRLLHFLSAALLVANYLNSSNLFFKSIGARAVIQTGRYSLEVFCLSAICSVILNIIVVVDRPDVPARVLLDLSAIALILLCVAILKDAGDSRRRRADSGALAPVEELAARWRLLEALGWRRAAIVLAADGIAPGRIVRRLDVVRARPAHLLGRAPVVRVVVGIVARWIVDVGIPIRGVGVAVAPEKASHGRRLDGQAQRQPDSGKRSLQSHWRTP